MNPFDAYVDAIYAGRPHAEHYPWNVVINDAYVGSAALATINGPYLNCWFDAEQDFGRFRGDFDLDAAESRAYVLSRPAFEKKADGSYWRVRDDDFKRDAALGKRLLELRVHLIDRVSSKPLVRAMSSHFLDDKFWFLPRFEAAIAPFPSPEPAFQIQREFQPDVPLETFFVGEKVVGYFQLIETDQPWFRGTFRAGPDWHQFEPIFVLQKAAAKAELFRLEVSKKIMGLGILSRVEGKPPRKVLALLIDGETASYRPGYDR